MSEIDATFDPFEKHIEIEKAYKILKNTLTGAEDGELFLERKLSESVMFDDKKMRNATFDISQGFGLRAVCEERVGFAYSNEISESALLNASSTAKLAVKSETKFSDPPRRSNRKLYSLPEAVSSIPFSVKVELMREIDDYARALSKKVIQVSISIGYSNQDIMILKPEDLLYKDSRPMARFFVSLILENNGRRETGSSGGGGRVNLNEVISIDSWKHHVDEAYRIALLNLKSEPAPAGEMDVVLGPGWPGIMLHEAVGHGLEGDFNRKKTSAFSHLLGKKVASSKVTVVDDGTIPNRRGSISIDDEGTPSARNTLIKDGILINYMQDRQNARLMKTDPTGNGRRQSYAHTPMPRMTNTLMEPGLAEPNDIIAGVKSGVYAVGFSGGQVDITNGKFVFSCTEAYQIENGKIGKALKGATLIGDGATAMKNIKELGNDFALDPGVGNCGKAGQWVPVGVGQPTTLISGLTIGGSNIKN